MFRETDLNKVSYRSKSRPAFLFMKPRPKLPPYLIISPSNPNSDSNLYSSNLFYPSHFSTAKAQDYTRYAGDFALILFFHYFFNNKMRSFIMDLCLPLLFSLLNPRLR